MWDEAEEGSKSNSIADTMPDTELVALLSVIC
jgi:hypothetical protein